MLNEIKKKGVTWTLLVLNVIAYILCIIFGDAVYTAGSLSVLDVIEKQEYYRIISSMFLHAGIDHILGNMLFVAILGDMLEQTIGHIEFGVIYLLTGIGGGVCSMLFELVTGDYYYTVGASGAVCGIMGALLVLTIRNHGSYGHVSLNRMLLAIIYMIYTGLQSSVVNNAAHIGGLLSGVLIMTVLVFIPKNKYK